MKMRAQRREIENKIKAQGLKCNDFDVGGKDGQVEWYYRSKFILSPPGNGMECHRHWEILALGKSNVVIFSPPSPNKI